MGTGTFYPEKKTKFFSGLKVPVPIVPPITTYNKSLVYTYSHSTVTDSCPTHIISSERCRLRKRMADKHCIVCQFYKPLSRNMFCLETRPLFTSVTDSQIHFIKIFMEANTMNPDQSVS